MTTMIKMIKWYSLFRYMYKKELSKILCPIGFVLKKNTFIRLKNDCIQTIMLRPIDNAILFDCYPLFSYFSDFYCEGEDIAVFSKTDWYTFRGDTSSPSVAILEICKIIKDNIIPIFEEGDTYTHCFSLIEAIKEKRYSHYKSQKYSSIYHALDQSDVLWAIERQIEWIGSIISNHKERICTLEKKCDILMLEEDKKHFPRIIEREKHILFLLESDISYLLNEMEEDKKNTILFLKKNGVI